MKHLHGAADSTVSVPIDGCLAFLEALEAYPSWHADVVREVKVVESGDDGLPLKAETKLHLSYGPVSRDLDLLLAVQVQRPGLVRLTHVPRGASSGASFDATWRLESDGVELDVRDSSAVSAAAAAARQTAFRRFGLSMSGGRGHDYAR